MDGWMHKVCGRKASSRRIGDGEPRVPNSQTMGIRRESKKGKGNKEGNGKGQGKERGGGGGD